MDIPPTGNKNTTALIKNIKEQQEQRQSTNGTDQNNHQQSHTPQGNGNNGDDNPGKTIELAKITPDGKLVKFTNSVYELEIKYPVMATYKGSPYAVWEKEDGILFKAPSE